MLNDWAENIKNFFQTYLASDEVIATLLIIFVIILKFFVNKRATAIDYKKMIVSLPSEIYSLIVGFLLSSLISNVEESKTIMAAIIIVLIFLVLQYAAERWLNDKLSGKLKPGIFICILLMYVISFLTYIIVVFGGMFEI